MKHRHLSRTRSLERLEWLTEQDTVRPWCVARRLFIVLWELPVGMQAAVPQALLALYGPAYALKHPALPSLERLSARASVGFDELGDAQLGAYNEQLRDDDADPADLAALSVVSRIRDLQRPPGTPEIAASAAVAAIESAIEALAQQAWLRADPQALQIWRDFDTWQRQGAPLGGFDLRDLRTARTSSEAAFVRAVAYSELPTMLYLAGVTHQPDIADRDRLAYCLRNAQRWRESPDGVWVDAEPATSREDIISNRA